MGGVIPLDVAAIDPGDDTGWAHYRSRRLVRLGLTHPKDFEALPFTMGLAMGGPLLLVFELPEAYESRNVDPNNLISLAVKVGIIEGVFRAYAYLANRVLTVEKWLPKEWKGQVPKPICHNRTLEKLDSTERSIVNSALESIPAGKRHDMLDAMSIGAWKVKR